MQWSHSRADEFRSVYDQVYPILIRIVYRVTNDMEIAEELCQEAFIKFFERMENFPDNDQAKYWLIRVSKNLALNYQKRKGRERRAYERVFREPQKQEDSGETAILKKESHDLVKAALETLPGKMKEVLVLKEYGDLNYREIATVLGISEGNVKVRVFRARERLAEALNRGDVYVP